jgi:putative membrane protein
VLGLGLCGWLGLRWRTRREGMALSRTRLVLFVAGVGAVWIALDWPIGALGAGYLLSVHTVQYLLLTFAASPLMLLGLAPARIDAAPGSTTTRPGDARRALMAFATYNGVLAITHVPALVDGLMPVQLGAAALDLAWLVGGVALWLPVLHPDRQRRLPPPLQMLYLFVSTLLPTVPAAFLTFADYPLYGLYELAPRVHGISASSDQVVAGLLMKLAADPPIWVALGVIFFRWQREES